MSENFQIQTVKSQTLILRYRGAMGVKNLTMNKHKTTESSLNQISQAIAAGINYISDEDQEVLSFSSSLESEKKFIFTKVSYNVTAHPSVIPHLMRDPGAHKVRAIKNNLDSPVPASPRLCRTSKSDNDGEQLRKNYNYKIQNQEFTLKASWTIKPRSAIPAP